MKKIFAFSTFVALLCGATLSAAQSGGTDLDRIVQAPIAQGEMRETTAPPAQTGAMEEPEMAIPSPQRATPPPPPVWETREGVEEAAKAYFLTLPAPQRERIERVTREIRYVQANGASKAQVEKLRAELSALRRVLGDRFDYMESMLRNKLDAMERRLGQKIEAEAEATRKVVVDEAERTQRRLDNQGILIVLGVLLPIVLIAIVASVVWALTRTNNQGA